MIATIRGVALSPGVSRNGRLYTAETIARAVVRAQRRIAEGVRPVSMRSHHAAGDDSTRLTGHLTELSLDPGGRARFAGVIEGNTAGRDIATLADSRDKPATLRGLSIRGAWIGPVRQVTYEGRECETADDLEITGLDWTAEPGVDDAGVEDIEFVDDGGDAGAQETAGERHPITESVEETAVTITEQTSTPATPAAAPAAPAAVVAEATPAAVWADRGYRGMPKWPLDTGAQARAAWIGLAESAGGYTAPQVKRMRGRIKSALERHGVQLTTEGWLVGPPTAITESTPAGVAECYGCYDDGDGSFYVTVSNGKLSVNVSSYCVDPGDLDTVARAAMDGACKALAGMTPDDEGDGDASAGGSTETAPAPAAAVGESAPAAPPAAAAAAEAPAAAPATGSAPTTEEAAVSEPSTEAAATSTAPSITFTGDQFTQFLDRIAPPAAPAAAATPAAPVETAAAPAAGAVTEAAPAAAAAPAPVATPAAAPAAAAPAVAETETERVSRLVREGIAAAVPAIRTELIQEIARSYPPARRGLVTGAGVGEASGAAATPVAEGLPDTLAQKPLHDYDDGERAALDRYIASAVLPAAAMANPSA